MPKGESINQNLPDDALPDFRSLGATLRIVVLVNGFALLVSLMQAVSLIDIVQHFIDISAFLQPVLMTSLLVLYALNAYLMRMIYLQGVGAVMMLVATVTLAINFLGGELYSSPWESTVFAAWRNALLGGVISWLILLYFKYRAVSLSGALHDARLQALQARIRPHFLFNSINAVLSIIRADPRRAETALEDMADLFRMAMAENQEMALLQREIGLSRQYLALEKLRLGERLQVNWQVGEGLQEAMVPSLMLQPLLENAVYHGIEPLAEGGVIEVVLKLSGGLVHIDVRNPCNGKAVAHKGNKMALENIRERLARKFDVEAKYKVDIGNDYYQVHIQLPYVRGEKNE